MRAALFAAVLVLVSGCVVETAQGPGVRPAKLVSEPPRCKDERTTGTNIERRVCQPELSPVEEIQTSDWRNHYPFNPLSSGAYTTDDHGVRIYH